MYYLFYKIRPFSVGWIAQPPVTLFYLCHLFFSFFNLCTICLDDPESRPHVSLKKYYIFAYLQIKTMTLFKIILVDMRFLQSLNKQ